MPAPRQVLALRRRGHRAPRRRRMARGLPLLQVPRQPRRVRGRARNLSQGDDVNEFCTLFSVEFSAGCDPPSVKPLSIISYLCEAGKAGHFVHMPVSYTHLRAHETDSYLVCRLLLEKKKRIKA